MRRHRPLKHASKVPQITQKSRRKPPVTGKPYNWWDGPQEADGQVPMPFYVLWGPGLVDKCGGGGLARDDAFRSCDCVCLTLFVKSPISHSVYGKLVN